MEEPMPECRLLGQRNADTDGGLHRSTSQASNYTYMEEAEMASAKPTGECREVKDRLEINGRQVVGTLKSIAHALTGMQVAMQTMKDTMEKTDHAVRNVASKLKEQGATVSSLKRRVLVLEGDAGVAGPLGGGGGGRRGGGKATRARGSVHSSRFYMRVASAASARGRPGSEGAAAPGAGAGAAGAAAGAGASAANLETTPPPMPPCCDERLAALGLNMLKAAQSGRARDVFKLLVAGADPNFTYGSKWTALHRAVAKAHAHVVQVLLENSARVDSATCYGLTPLHIAAFHDYTGRCLQLLLEARADFTRRDRHGWTPLHYAAQSGNLIGVRALRAVGASQNAMDNCGKTPFDVTKMACIRRLIRTCSRGEWARSYVCRFKSHQPPQEPAPAMRG